MNSIAPETGTILIVDDTPDNIVLMREILKGTYRIKVATSGKEALEIVNRGDDIDLILLDIVMPEMDGFEVCRILKQNPASMEIPVIFLTAMSESRDEQTGLELGAVDYIAKPPSPAIVLARINNHLHLKSCRDFLIDKNEYLEKEISRRTMEIRMIQDITMVALGSLAETRDNETGNHIRRTQHFLRAMATRVRDLPRFREYLTDETIDLLYKSAPLHDIGKVGIPDRILLKPGKLDAAEFEIMKTHTTLGRDAILKAEKALGSPNSFLHFGREIAWLHHERWDGTGYPCGLRGTDIPIPALLMSIPDVYDALISKRVYKEAFSHEEAVAVIRKGAGGQFDPDLVKAFLDLSPQFETIVQSFSDSKEPGA